MTESTPTDAMSAADRRRLQNRIAQRRFRQKKALEQQCWLIDNTWHADTDGYSIPTVSTAVSLVAAELPMAGGAHSAIGTTPNLSVDPSMRLLDQQLQQWECQSSADAFGLASIPGQRGVTAISPPTSISSASSEYGIGSSDGSAQNDPSGNLSILQADAMLRDLLHQTNATGGTATDYAVLPQSGPSNDLLNRLRDELVAQWKHEKHPNPNWGAGKDQLAEPLIHTAVRHGNCDIVQMLVNHGADVNEQDSMGRSPIHIAIESQKAEVLMLLLETGTDVNLSDNEGRTALSMAVNNGCEAGVRLFLMHGANPRCGAPAPVPT